MLGIFLERFAIAMGVVLVVFSAASAFRSARLLNRRITQFKAEQEVLEKQGKAINPYAALAELYAEETPTPRGPARSGKNARRAHRFARETHSVNDKE